MTITPTPSCRECCLVGRPCSDYCGDRADLAHTLDGWEPLAAADDEETTADEVVADWSPAVEPGRCMICDQGLARGGRFCVECWDLHR